VESNHRPTDYESVSYECRVLLIKHLRRSPISQPVSSSHSYVTANLAKAQLGSRGLAHASERAQVLIESRKRAFDKRGILTRACLPASERNADRNNPRGLALGQFEFRFLYAPRFFGGARRLRARRSFLLHGLPRRNVSDQLCKLYRIARAFNAFLGHVALPESYWRYFFKNASTRR
jgi:hypothetical protein